MIKIIVALIPLLAFGYIMYDFFSSKIKKKKNLIKLRDELINRLNIGYVDSATHSLQIRVSSTDTTFNGSYFTVWCKRVGGVNRFFNPISRCWLGFNGAYDIAEYMTYSEPFRGDVGFRNTYHRHMDMVKITIIKPTKSIRKHSFTH